MSDKYSNEIMSHHKDHEDILDTEVSEDEIATKSDNDFLNDEEPSDVETALDQDDEEHFQVGPAAAQDQEEHSDVEPALGEDNEEHSHVGPAAAQDQEEHPDVEPALGEDDEKHYMFKVKELVDPLTVLPV
jgi:hypothetical protein